MHFEYVPFVILYKTGDMSYKMMTMHKWGSFRILLKSAKWTHDLWMRMGLILTSVTPALKLIGIFTF